MPSIFEIERRMVDLDMEVLTLHKLLDEIEISFNGIVTSVNKAIDMTFIYWPHRGRSINKNQYFSAIGITNLNRLTEVQFLYYIEFVINYANWLNSLAKTRSSFFSVGSPNELSQDLSPISHQVKFTLEAMNYKTNFN